MREVSQLDWARLAMAIDGEGNISIQQSSTTAKGKTYRNHVLRVNVSNTDFRLALWIKRIFGGRTNPRPKRNPRWKPSLEWNTQATHAAKILEACLPYFILKRQQAEIGLAFQSTKRKAGGPKLGSEILFQRSELTSRLRELNRKGPRAA